MSENWTPEEIADRKQYEIAQLRIQLADAEILCRELQENRDELHRKLAAAQAAIWRHNEEDAAVDCEAIEFKDRDALDAAIAEATKPLCEALIEERGKLAAAQAMLKPYNQSMERTTRYRYFLAIFTLITVIVIAWILRPNLPVPVLAEPDTQHAVEGEARESTENCDLTGEESSMEDSRGGQNLSVSYGTLVMPTPLELPENYYQAQGTIISWEKPNGFWYVKLKECDTLDLRKHHGFWIP